ncbi:MAG: DinB family protein [Planctomycetota bacterium]
MQTALAEAWCMSNEANLFLLESIPQEHLADRYSARTRTVGGQFAHMHGVRIRCLKFMAPDLVGTLEAFPRGAQPRRAALVAALKKSQRPIADLLERSEEVGRVKSWNGSPATFLGYLVAHEAHHRGLAMVALRAADHKPPDEVVHGQWQWGKQRNTR